ncbi:pyridoxal phosphate-dependent decarboxylase family protein [Sciscionella marina]|uniref:pyridoxal phosphate-dependent decarboxylase family protein n=1 Tax=Sciscionella marina TaxID=508770 RepID=UPI00038251A8|nr:pyridoxal-dependent decarboxylase [Sciscionella marina]
MAIESTPVHEDDVQPSPLVFGPAARARANELLTRFLDDYERSLPERSLLPALDRDVLAELLTEPVPEEGIGVDAFFAELYERVLPNSTAVAHPRFLAYVQGPPNSVGPYADAIAATLNQNCNFWQLSPAASVIERSVVRWLSGLFELGAAAGGILTSGGSVATLNALTVALVARRPDFRRRGLQDRHRPPLVVYTSQEAHRCVDKAAAILGLGLDNVRHISTDEQFRMRVDLLEEAVRADRAAGREPCCVVATAGTVTSGSVDPIAEIADVAGKHELWLHVDGAYGALFVLAEQTRELFAGCSRADSIALDPHKMLFAPYEVGCLVVRDAESLRAAYSFSAAYLTVEPDPLMIDFMDYGPQLSRGFKAFKVWAALRTFGAGAFRDAARRCLELAAHLGRRVAAEPGLELLNPVTLTAVCLRIDGRTDAEHTAILRELITEGTALLGPARLGERTGIRACVTNHRTTKADIDLVVDRLAAYARS